MAGLFSRRTASNPPQADSGYSLPLPEWASDPSWWQAEEPPLSIVAGESFHKGELAALAGPPRPSGWLIPIDVILEREPNNKYDSNALAVKIAGGLAGYVAKEWAAFISPAVDAANLPGYPTRGVIRGGWTDAPSFGVCLWLDGMEPNEEWAATMGPLVERSPDVSYWAMGLASPDCPPFSAGLPPREENLPVMDEIRSYPNFESRWAAALPNL